MRKFFQRLLSAPRALLGVLIYVAMAFVHVFTPVWLFARRERKALAVMSVSLVLFGIGLLRLQLYSVPMLRGDYESAARGKTEYNFEVEDDTPQPADLFQSDSLFQRTVDGSIRLAGRTSDALVGDRVAAKFNHGLELYRESRYEEAVKALGRAYAAVSDGDGKVKPGYQKLASEIQFLIGNSNANSNKIPEAVDAYKLSLTHDPDNMTTIYNLERLLSSGGGDGGDNGDKPKPANPINTRL